jgi:iron(III) transport system ATP-binding protein
MSASLDVRDLRKQFAAGRPAVDGVSFHVPAGEIVVLLGPSGCGKTTTLRCIAGLEHATAGRVSIGGRLMSAPLDGIQVPPRLRNIGMVFQSYAVWPHMTVRQNVAYPLRHRRTPRAEVERKTAEVLELVGLAQFAERSVVSLSGGQMQRVALARSLVYQPQLLLLDEPLSNLDARLREHMRVELRALQQRLGIAVLFVTHDQAEAMVLSDRSAVMHAGRIEQVGTPITLYERPATSFVRDFLGRVLTLPVIISADDCAEVHGEPGALVQLPPGAQLPASAGGRLVMACRPEDVHIEAQAEPGLNRLSARIETAAYLGEHIEYGVRTAGGQLLLVISPRRQRYDLGAPVSVRVDTSEATLWAGE